MGSLPADTRCTWCGRKGASYIPDGIWEPLCSTCLAADVTRFDVKFNGLIYVLGRRRDPLGSGPLFLAEPDIFVKIAEYL